MFRQPLLVAALSLVSLAASAQQSSTNGKLAFIIPDLYGPGGLTLPNPNHFAHFDSSFQTNFVPFNTALASQLTSLPIPSPASGFTYTFDKSLGVYSRSNQSFGPILAERAETLGKDKFFFGFAYQRFRFDTIDGLNLHQVPVVFQHGPAANPDFQKDIITANNFLDVHLGQLSAFFTYGLTDRLDVSVAVPFVSADVTAVSNATIHRIGTANDPTIHYFDTPNGPSTQAQFAGSGTASGLGDVIVRLKGTVLKSAAAGLALGIDLRAPTGDEYNFLGSGSVGVKPFAAASFRTGRVSPHLNAAFQWNGQTVLAGDVATGRKERLPNQIFYAAGADVGVNSKFTLALDLLGREIVHTQRVVQSTFTAFDSSTYQQINFQKHSLHEVDGAAGFKVNAVGNLLVSFNVIFKLNNDGLRGRVTPLVGVSYTF